MPTIPIQTSRQPVQPYRAQGVDYDDSVGQAMRQLGSAVSGLAGLANLNKQKQKQKDALAASTGMQTLNEQLNQDLIEANEKAPADGTGLMQGFQDNSLTPKTDAFLATIKDPELRQEYELRLGPLREKYKNDAVNAEANKGNAFSLGQVGQLQQDKAVGIASDPNNFENYVADFEQIVDDAPQLTPTQRDELKRKWRQAAPAILAETLKTNDPQTLYYATGHGKGDERRSYIAKSIVGAIAQAETAGRTDLDGLVSNKGALGRMQIMPDTALEIAKDLHDDRFLRMDDEARKRYLLSESVSYRYGEHYISKMLKQNDNNLTLALIAYNAGQERANEFVEKGGDWSKMGKWAKETMPYVNKVMGLIGTKRFAANTGVPKTKVEQTLGSGKRLALTFGTQPGRTEVNDDITTLDKDLVDKWELVQGAFGKQLPVVSGYRGDVVKTDPKTGRAITRNEIAGGADDSRHLHHDAIDIDVRGLSKAERLKLIELGSAAGMTGIGVYNTTIHFDTRDARKSWGPNYSITSLPDWAKPTIEKHLAGAYGSGAGTTIASGSGGAGKPGPLSIVEYSRGGAGQAQAADGEEPTFIFDGFKEMSPANLVQTRQDGLAGVKRADDQQRMAKELAKAEANQLADQDIASMRQSGRSSIAPEDMDDFTQKLMLSDGPAAVLQWERDRTRAQRVFAMTQDVHQLSSSQLDQLLDLNKPSGGPHAADDQYVYDEATKVVEAEKTLRLKDPGLAVQQHAGVRPLAEKVDWKNPDTVEDYLTRVFEVQDALGMERTPLPHDRAERIGRSITTLIKMNPDTDPGEITKGVLQDLYQRFGAFADEVFMQSFETIVDPRVSKETKGIMSSSMLEWIKETPGLNDPNYRRLKLKYNWNYKPEFAAQDKVPLGDDDDAFRYTLPAELGAQSGRAVRDWIGGLFSGGGQPSLPPGEVMPGGLKSLRPAPQGGAQLPMRIKGVPNAALDQLLSNPGDPAAQAAFRKQFGGEAFTEAQKLLKQQQDPRK